FIRQHDEPDGSAIAAHSLIHALRLNRKSAAVVVRLAVDQQNRRFQLVGVHERRHVEVRLWSFPQRALLALETERRQRASVRAAARDAGAEEFGMSEEIRGHESAVAVAA